MKDEKWPHSKGNVGKYSILLCHLFGIVKWPPTRWSKGHFESPGGKYSIRYFSRKKSFLFFLTSFTPVAPTSSPPTALPNHHPIWSSPSLAPNSEVLLGKKNFRIICWNHEKRIKKPWKDKTEPELKKKNFLPGNSANVTFLGWLSDPFKS